MNFPFSLGKCYEQLSPEVGDGNRMMIRCFLICSSSKILVLVFLKMVIVFTNFDNCKFLMTSLQK